PQASVTFQVRVCARLQPLLVIELSDADGVTLLQLSVAVAVPRASLIAAADGLQPRVKVAPVAVITGAAVSTTVTFWLHVILWLHESVANQVRIISFGQVPLVVVLSVVTVTGPQHASVTDG